MLVKLIKSYRDIVAVCDSELLGKYFEEEGFQLDVKENFFNGEKKTESELIEIMQNMKKEDAIFNIVGERSINTGIKAGIISQDSVKTIRGVPFALVLI